MTKTSLHLPVPIEEFQRILRKHNVSEAYIFGSYSRQENTEDSDIDMLVKFNATAKLSGLCDLQFEFDEKIPVDVDVATKLNKHFEPYIRDELVRIL